MDRMKKLILLVGTSLVVLTAGFALLSYLGGAQLVPSMASDDDAEFAQAMATVRAVVEEPEAVVDWVSVYGALLRLKELRNPRCAPLLAQLLTREEPLEIKEGSPLPGVMPPLEMLKAAAIDTLVEVRATQHLQAIKSVHRQTRFMVLRDVAGNAVRSLAGGGEE